MLADPTLAESDSPRGRRFEVIAGKKQKPPQPPTTPAGAVWVPRGDRWAIVQAFQHGVSIARLSSRQRRKYLVIEAVLRDHVDELHGRINAMEERLRLHVLRSAA